MTDLALSNRREFAERRDSVNLVHLVDRKSKMADVGVEHLHTRQNRHAK